MRIPGLKAFRQTAWRFRARFLVTAPSADITGSHSAWPRSIIVVDQQEEISRWVELLSNLTPDRHGQTQ